VNIVEEWAPLPITDQAIEQLRANCDNEIRLVAEVDGEAVGIGAFALKSSALVACYVAPNATRKGIGSALVSEIERIAKDHGLTHLRVDSSTTGTQI
jgi:putative acetyltransferase